MKDFFNRDEVLNVLQGFNPWWANKSYAVPEFRRIAFEACRKYLEDMALKRAVLLSGPRHVGKTTVLLQIADELVKSGKDPKSIFYISLDHPLLKLLSIRNVLSLYGESVYPTNKPTYLLFDEIQYSNEWETEIKLLVDHQPFPDFRQGGVGTHRVNFGGHVVLDRVVFETVIEPEELTTSR